MATKVVTGENLAEFATKLNEKQKTIFAPMAAVGAPLTAETAAGMTDETKVYVYTGEEVGYTYGNWYYYDGTGWVSGGIYNSAAVNTDTTLSVSGKAADAKATGDGIAKINTLNYVLRMASDLEAEFESQIAGEDVVECYTELPYSATPYTTTVRLIHYNGNLATGRMKDGQSLNENGVIQNSSGNTLIGPLVPGSDDTMVYIWWNKDSDAGRTARAFAYNVQDTASELWSGSITSRNQNKNASLPAGTAYVYASTGWEAMKIRASFRQKSQLITLPENFYGGVIDYKAGTITLLYDASGNLLDEPVVTDIGSDIDLKTYKGTNDYYTAASNALHTPLGTTTVVSKQYLMTADAELGERIDGVNRMLLDGYSLKITSDDLVQQGFTGADGVKSSKTRIGIKAALPVREGTRILYPYTGLYYMIWFLRTANLIVPDVISSISWARLTEVTVPEGCRYIYTAIANASTSGTSTTIVPSDFTGEITFIEKNHIDSSVAELKAYVDNGDVNTYVVEEADRVADKVRNVQTGSSLTFAAISDMHYNVDDSAVAAALIDMRNAVNKVKTQVNVDFFTSFGDITYRLNTNGSYAKGKAECIAATKLLGECFGDAPQIRMIGNHDPNSEAATGYFTANQMGAYTSVFSNLLTVRDEEHPYAGIGWHDFERQKVRVIALDTSFYDEDGRPTASATYYAFGNAQAYWLCQALDMSDKDDADEWQIVTVSHIQIDLSDTSAHAAAIGKYSAVLDAYVKGGSWSAGDYSYNFSGKNDAMLALCIHGHSHLYNVRNVQNVNSSAVVQNTLPVADLYVPNALPGREGTSMDGVTYTKTAGTAESTAFQMITLDSVNKILYAHHYGAGIDIILHYASSTSDSLTTTLESPVWGTKDGTIATVDGGTVTPVADGDVMIYAKSETDNTIEAWNYHSEV